MKKFLYAFSVVAAVFFFSSAYSPENAGTRVGSDAAGFAVTNDSNAISLQSLRGSYVLISFWSSTDANSRIANKMYNDFALNDNVQLNYVAVNFDPSENVFDEITNIDKLHKPAQFHVNNGEKSVFFEKYRLDEGYKSYLVNPDGVIIAENPTESDLIKLTRI